VRLDAICDVTGVNALAVGQRLEFHPQLTAIYGENGSGKSGYARVLGSAGFTRGDSMVLPDVTQPLRENATQSATITVTAGDCTQSFDYEVGAQCPRLSGFYVFDSTAVRVHMSAPNAMLPAMY